MPKLTAQYHFIVPEILIVGDIQLEPIKSFMTIGEVTIYPPEGKDKSPSPSGFWNADNVRVVQEIELSTSLTGTEREELLLKSRKDIEELTLRFLRLLRRKLQTPMFLPTALQASVNYQWSDLRPNGWIPVAQVYVGAIHVVQHGAGLTKDKWAKLAEEMNSGIQTELWEDFIEDSKAALYVDDLNRATIYAAIGLEIFIKEYARKAATKLGLSQKFWEYLTSPQVETRAVHYYDAILHLVTKHSMKDENRDLYRLVERIFKKRNDIMHEGKLALAEQDRARLKEDIQAVEQVISWVHGLQTSPNPESKV